MSQKQAFPWSISAAKDIVVDMNVYIILCLSCIVIPTFARLKIVFGCTQPLHVKNQIDKEKRKRYLQQIILNQHCGFLLSNTYGHSDVFEKCDRKGTL